MSKKNKKANKSSKLGNLLCTFTMFLGVIFAITVVFSKATLAKVNFEVEKQKKEIEVQKKTNESIAMAIDELASLSKIQEVAEEQGLSYNNNNIKTIVEDN